MIYKSRRRLENARRGGKAAVGGLPFKEEVSLVTGPVSEGRRGRDRDIERGLTASQTVMNEMVAASPFAPWPKGWDNTSDPCDDSTPWLGVTCHSHQVTGIYLQEPNSFANQDVSIFAALGNLPYLEELVIPRLGLTGKLPLAWAKLSGISVINVDGNMLEGQVPREYKSMTRLTNLLLAENRLSGALAEMPVEYFTKLLCLRLTGNRFTGTIPPAWGGLKELFSIDLSSNYLHGPLPSWPLLAIKASSVDVSYNFINVTASHDVMRQSPWSGSNIAPQFDQAQWWPLQDLLEVLGVDMAVFPSPMRLDIEAVEYRFHNFVSQPTALSFSRRRMEDIYSFKQTGTFPPPSIEKLASIMARLSHLISIDLSGHGIVGDMAQIALPPTLQHLRLGGNNIGGRLPLTLPGRLLSIDLSHNFITGCFDGDDRSCVNPSDYFPSSIEFINLSTNNFTGLLTFDSTFTGHCPHNNLTWVDMSENGFTEYAEALFRGCSHPLLFKSVRNKRPIYCSLPVFSSTTLAILDRCEVDISLMMQIIYFALALVVALPLLFILLVCIPFKAFRKFLASCLKWMFLIRFTLGVMFSIYDMYVDTSVYLTMISETSQFIDSTVIQCDMWNNNTDLTLRQFTSIAGEGSGNDWQAQDVVAIFSDETLRSLTADKDGGAGGASNMNYFPFFVNLIERLNIFDNNDAVVKSLMDFFAVNCETSKGDFCHFDFASKQCRANTTFYTGVVLPLVWASLSFVALKELLKLLTILVLTFTCRKRVPTYLRSFVKSSCFSPLLLFPLGGKEFYRQIVDHDDTFCDKSMGFALETIGENLNQLALGVFYLIAVTQQGLGPDEIQFYPMNILSMITNFLQLMRAGYRSLRGIRRKATSLSGGVDRGSVEGAFDTLNPLDNLQGTGRPSSADSRKRAASAGGKKEYEMQILNEIYETVLEVTA
jgi:hypothetical protein